VAGNSNHFDFYYFLALSKPPSRQQIYFQNQCFTMENSELPYRSVDP